MTVLGVDDFASMREVVHRRYRRLKEEDRPMPSLVLIDGGLGQLHAAADALESLGFTSQPLASIAKKEEVIYLYGNEDEPIVLDRRSPVLHLVQLIRDESHRLAVGYHRQRRAMRKRDSELLTIPGVGPQTRQRFLTYFGSLHNVQQCAAGSVALERIFLQCERFCTAPPKQLDESRAGPRGWSFAHPDLGPGVSQRTDMKTARFHLDRKS